MAFVRVRRIAMSVDQRCPLCRGDLAGAASETLSVCGGCDAVHHLGCVDEFGKGLCATLGCRRRLTDAQVPIGDEVAGGERKLVVPGFAHDMALLWATGLAVFVFVMVLAYGVAELRWPAWTLPAGTTLPVFVFVAWKLIQDLRERNRPGK